MIFKTTKAIFQKKNQSKFKMSPRLESFLWVELANNCFYLIFGCSWAKFEPFLRLIQSYQDVPFSGTKWPIWPEQSFLIQTSIISFIHLMALFIVQNLQKILAVNPKLWGCPIFGPKMAHLPQTIFFGGKL